jgi:hypothetical protein
MRAVTSATAAIALSIDRKSLDNMLARIGGDELGEGRQGVERRIAVSTLEELALCMELTTALSVPVREAFLLARRLLRREDLAREFIGSVAIGPHLQLGLDLRGFLQDLHARLAVAIESHVRPRRGRPKSKQAPGA